MGQHKTQCLSGSPQSRQTSETTFYALSTYGIIHIHFNADSLVHATFVFTNALLFLHVWFGILNTAIQNTTSFCLVHNNLGVWLVLCILEGLLDGFPSTNL
jgi:hypothetical protein